MGALYLIRRPDSRLGVRTDHKVELYHSDTANALGVVSANQSIQGRRDLIYTDCMKREGAEHRSKLCALSRPSYCS